MKRPEPTEIVAVFAPVLAEFVAVALAVFTAALWILYLGGRLELPV